MKVFSEKLGHHIAKYGQYVFAVTGIVALGYCASVFLHARLFQSKEAHNFALELQTHVTEQKNKAKPETSTRSKQQAPVEGTVIARLSIPRLGLSTMVVEGDTDGDLKVAPGHIPGTALPGEPGNIGIAGHRDTFFRPLRLIHKDDGIALTTLHGEDRYQVVSTEIVNPKDVEVLYPTSRNTLTLVTCYPFNYAGSAPDRFIVRAERERQGFSPSPADNQHPKESLDKHTSPILASRMETNSNL